MKSFGTHRSYIAGFIVSALCTLLAYQLVMAHVSSGHEQWSHPVILAGLVALGLVQLVVQLVLFLHLGQEARPRWQLWAFGFMGLVLAILVGGSLWIMNNLDYHMMPTHTDASIIEDEGMHPAGGHQH